MNLGASSALISCHGRCTRTGWVAQALVLLLYGNVISSSWQAAYFSCGIQDVLGKVVLAWDGGRGRDAFVDGMVMG